MNLWFTHLCFDKDKVQKELDLQRDVTQQFGQNMVMASGLIVDKLSEASRKKKYEAAVELENAKKAREENDSETNRAWEKQAQANFDTANREAKEWETGGSQRRMLDSALNVVSTFLAGRPATEVVASGLSPTINHQIKEMTTDKNGNVITPVNLMAHAIWGGIEAYAGNRSVAAGAAGAVTGEAAAGIISQILYDKSPNKLSQDEKLTVSTTLPPNDVINTKLAGKKHPVTGVPFDNKGYSNDGLLFITTDHYHSFKEIRKWK